MTRGTSVSVVGADELRALSRALRRQANGRELQKQLRAELREAAKPLVPAVRSAIRSMPSKDESRRRGRPSLRRQMARSVTVQVKTGGRNAGVSVFMSPKKMPDGKKSLPSYFELRPGYLRLRHPVFGNAEVWVTQRVPVQGYFTRSVHPEGERRAVRAVNAVMERMALQIEDA